MAEEVKPMSIDDIIAKAHHKDITEHGNAIQDALEGSRLELLSKHYAASLPKDKREEFEKLTEFEKGVRLAKNDYKLPQDYAEAFVMDIAHRVLQGAAPKKAEEMQKQMNILKNKDSTPEQKRDAHREIDHFMAIVMSYGIDVKKLQEGKAIGFGPQLFKEAVGEYGEVYKQKESSYWTNQISNDMANKYLEKIKEHADLKEFNVDLAKDMHIDHKRKLITTHYQAKKNEKEGQFDILKKIYEQYFKKPETEKKSAKK